MEDLYQILVVASSWSKSLNSKNRRPTDKFPFVHHFGNCCLIKISERIFLFLKWRKLYIEYIFSAQRSITISLCSCSGRRALGVENAIDNTLFYDFINSRIAISHKRSQLVNIYVLFILSSHIRPYIPASWRHLALCILKLLFTSFCLCLQIHIY